MSAVPAILPADTQMSREEWLFERKKGIGSSDIAALVSADPYRGPLDVWLDKTGRDRAGIETRPMRLGRALEPIILAEFIEETGREARLDGVLAVHPTVQIARATPDSRLVAEPAGVELKAPGFRQAGHWGRSWSNEYPEQYVAQCAWQMAVLDLDEWYLAALLGGQDFRVYRIHRDRELEEGLLEAAQRFWKDHVLADVAPPLDASDAARRYVESRFPTSVRSARVATPEEEVLIHELADARARERAAEADFERIGTLLRESIGEAEAVELKGLAKIGWKSQRGRTTTDWKSIAATFNPPAELITQHTTTGAPTRVFRPSGRLFPSRREEGME
jgi:putative phage-type endonuclease